MRSQRHLTIKAIRAILNHGGELELRRLALRGRARWLGLLRPWRGDLFYVPGGEVPLAPPVPPPVTSCTTPSTSSSHGSPEDAQIDVIRLACPTCAGTADGTREAFCLTKLDQRTWCKHCSKSRFVRLWRCPCGRLWHTCPVHVAELARLRELNSRKEKRSLQRTGLERPQLKRTRHLQDQSTGRGVKRNGEWLDKTPKQARTVAVNITFSKRETDGVRDFDPRFLSPLLKRRFAHLCTDCTE